MGYGHGQGPPPPPPPPGSCMHLLPFLAVSPTAPWRSGAPPGVFASRLAFHPFPLSAGGPLWLVHSFFAPRVPLPFLRPPPSLVVTFLPVASMTSHSSPADGPHCLALLCSPSRFCIGPRSPLMLRPRVSCRSSTPAAPSPSSAAACSSAVGSSFHAHRSARASAACASALALSRSPPLDASARALVLPQRPSSCVLPRLDR